MGYKSQEMLRTLRVRVLRYLIQSIWILFGTILFLNSLNFKMSYTWVNWQKCQIPILVQNSWAQNFHSTDMKYKLVWGPSKERWKWLSAKTNHMWVTASGQVCYKKILSRVLASENLVYVLWEVVAVLQLLICQWQR